MLAYDLHASYTSFTAASDDIARPLSHSGSDSDIEVTEVSIFFQLIILVFLRIVTFIVR